MSHRSLGRLCYTSGVLVLLGLLACHEPDDFSPTSNDVLAAIVMSLSSTSIPADGVSTLVITAKIDAHAAETNRKLLFKTADGTFLEATDEQPKQVERTVNVNGEATATLRSSRNVRPVEVSVEVVAKPSVFVTDTIDFVRTDAATTIAFVDTVSNAPADDATLTPVTVEIAPELPSGRRSVTFTTNRGNFAQGGETTRDEEAGADNRARVDLKSPPDAGPARLTATVDGVTTDHLLVFTPALPEAIVVTPTKVRLEATTGDAGTTSVTVQLLRSVGTVSTTPLDVKVVQTSSQTELPVLINGLGPSNSGMATFNLTIGALPVSSHGFAEIQVRAPDASVVGRATIEIVAASS